MVRKSNQIESNIWISLVFKTTLTKAVYFLKNGLCLIDLVNSRFALKKLVLFGPILKSIFSQIYFD